MTELEEPNNIDLILYENKIGGNMKRILIGYVNSKIGNGINKYIIDVIQYLKKNNCKVDLLTREHNQDGIKYWKEQGCDEIFVISRNRKPIKQFFEMLKIYKNNKYDVAYFNISEASNCIGIISAKCCNIKKIIVHSHNSNLKKNNILIYKIKKMCNYLSKPILTHCCNMFLSCSTEAAKWLYSKKIIKKELYKNIYNLVDYDKFKYDVKKREKLRKELNIENKFVIGHVGRFSKEKNQMFLLQILKIVLEKKKNAVLFLIGDGGEKNTLVEYTKKMKLEDKVVFTGEIKNTEDYYQIFDVFVLPSLYEGLPIVGVEAQFSLVPCLFSSKISKEVVISENAKLLNIDNPEIWANEIYKIKSRYNKLTKYAENFKLSNNDQFNCIID